MAVFADQLDLRTAVIELVKRPAITDVFKRLVLQAEHNFNRKLRLREQITSDTITFTSGVAPLPDDFQEAIGLYAASGLEYRQVPPQIVKRSGTEPFYAIVGTNCVVYSGDDDRELEYYASVPTITTSMSTTSWLLTKCPNLYLYGVGVEAAKYLLDQELLAGVKPIFDMEMAAAGTDDLGSRFARARVIPGSVSP